MQVYSYLFQLLLAVTTTPEPVPDPDSDTEPDPSTPSLGNWSKRFDTPGWSKCGEDNLFITGFYRSNPPDSSSDRISSLQQARCDNSTAEFRDQNGRCKLVDWRNSLGRWLFKRRYFPFPKFPCVVCGLYAYVSNV